MPEGEPRWIADPTRRHELRWWNGARWTEHVCDAGVVSEDWGPQGPPTPRTPTPRQRAPIVEDSDDERGLLEAPPHRQRERERRRTVLTIVAVILILAVSIAIAVTVSAR